LHDHSQAISPFIISTAFCLLYSLM